MNNIFILDGQTDEILGHINKKYVIENEHERDLPTHKDYFWFTVLADNKHAEHLNKRNGLIVPGEDGELLEFRIFESIKYRDNEGLKIEVHALATYLDLKNQKVFDPQKTSSETAQQHAKIALQGTEWQLGEVDFKGIRTLTFDNPFNSYDYILRIAREFELEPRFYIETDGQKVTGRYVDLVEQIGEFRGRTIEFGRDLERIERKEDTSEVVTALWIYGPEREDGTRLKVFVEDDEARERWGRKGKHIVDYYEPETENDDITEERLKTLGEMELRKRINAVVTYEAEILDLENVPGLENKKIRFGDTIRIKDVYFNPPLYVEARAFNVKRDVFNKAKKTVQLGDYVEYSEEEVKALFKQMQAEIRRRLERLVLVSIVSSAGNVFKNGVGSTELTAKTFLSGNEVDEDGTKYEHRWHKFDKNGDYVAGFYEEGKSITINASTIDEKATFRAEIILDNEVLTVHEITLTNVFDGEQGPPGPNRVDGNTEFGDGYDPTKIEIGGRNLLRNSDFSDGLTNWANEGYSLSVVDGVLIAKNVSGTGTRFYYDTIQMLVGETYTISFEAKADKNNSEIFLGQGRGSSNIGTIRLTTVWKRYNITFQSVNNFTISFHLSEPDVDYYFTNIKLEKGNKATDWTRAEEDVQEQIEQAEQNAKEYTDVAKDELEQDIQEVEQIAQNAMSTADGKNAVFRQPNTPPTADRKIGDLWLKTDEGNKMYVWTGSWTETKLDYQALSVNKLSAISADLGNMTAGHIEGVTMSLADGKFIVNEDGSIEYKGFINIHDGGGLHQDSYTYIDNTRFSTAKYTEGDFIGLWTGLWTKTDLGTTLSLTTYGKSPPAGIHDMIPASTIELGMYGLEINSKPDVHTDWTKAMYKSNGIDYEEAYLSPEPFTFDMYKAYFTGEVQINNNLSAYGIATYYNEARFYYDTQEPTRWTISRTSDGLEVRPRGTGLNTINNLSLNAGENSNTQVSGNLRVEGVLYSEGTWANTTSNSANVFLGGSAGARSFFRSTSAKKYKVHVNTVEVDPYKILQLNPSSWYDKGEVERNGKSIKGLKRHYGLIADEVARAGLKQYVTYEDREIDGLAYDRLWTLLIPIVRDLKERIDELERNRV